MSTKTPEVKTTAEYFKKDTSYFKRKKHACDILWYRSDMTTPVWHENCGCHGTMHNFPSGLGTKVYTSLYAKEEDYKETLRYWNFILDPKKSPWRRCLNNVDILYDEEKRPIAFGITDMEAPTQLGVNLMIQSRTPVEHPQVLKSFIFFNDNGFDEYESLWLSEHLPMDGTGVLRKIENSFMGFSASHANVSLARIREANPNTNTNVFRTSPQYTPCNAIWQSNDKTYAKTAVFTMLKASDSYDGVFAKAFAKLQSKTGNFKDKGIVAAKEAVTILKDKKDQWAPR